MASKVLNFKMEELEVADIKKVASVYHMTVTDIIKEAIGEYLSKLKSDPFYKLSINVEDAKTEESDEILKEIESLSDEDLEITSVKRFSL